MRRYTASDGTLYMNKEEIVRLLGTSYEMLNLALTFADPIQRNGVNLYPARQAQQSIIACCRDKAKKSLQRHNARLNTKSDFFARMARKWNDMADAAERVDLQEATE